MSEQLPYISLSPSSAGRWATCTASPWYIARNKHLIPEEEDSFNADEGTFAHERLEEMVNFMIDYDFDEKEAFELACANQPEDSGFDLRTDEDMKTHLPKAAKFIAGLKQENDDLVTELRVPIFYKDDQRGYIDYLFTSRKLIKIWDLKYGRVPVSARNNKQLAAYALSVYYQVGAERGWDDSTLCHLGIYQPRDFPAEKVWSVTIGELKAFFNETAETAKNIVGNPDGGEFVPTEDACRWCEMRTLCPARAESLFEPLPAATTEVLSPEPATSRKAVGTLPEVSVLTNEQIGSVLSVASDLEKWLKDVKELARSKAENGEAIQGHKLVTGRGQRSWSDPEAAEKLLRNKLKKDECYTSKLLSVPQAEKALKNMELSTRFKNQFDNLVVKNTGRPVLAPEEDKREAIVTAPAFDDLDEEAALENLL